MAQSQPKRLNKTKKAVISPGQSRAARGLLDISQRDLAEAAGVSLTAVKDFESGARTPRPATLRAMQDALENAGIELIATNGGGPGVRWRDPDHDAKPAPKERRGKNELRAGIDD